MKILLGFEVSSGNEVYMTNAHTVVTGMTQLSGKTTCLEALVERGKVKAVAFLTKRGESGFRGQREIQPYFKEQKRGNLIDWQYVEAILEATMGERMKFERSWIIKVCKGAHSLEEVYQNIKTEAKSTTRGLDQSVYTNLGAYFEIILPEIAKYDFADKLVLRKGFNVLNLIGMADEMQQLVIESVLSYILGKLRDTIVVIPEAHKFMPQGRKTPVKGTALRFIREGAVIGNFMWIDCQETTSVDKAILKQCSNWIMGYQQEKNEVANVRENIGRRKITEEQIMTLKLGHFIASLQQKIYHVYVLPSSIPKKEGRAVAMGEIPVEAVKNTIESFKRDPSFEEVAELPHEPKVTTRIVPREELDDLKQLLKTDLTEPVEDEREYIVKGKVVKGLLSELANKVFEAEELKKEVWAHKEFVDSMKINHGEKLKEKDRIISELKPWEKTARKQAETLLMQEKLLSEAEAKLRGFDVFEAALMDFLVPKIEKVLSMMDFTVDLNQSIEEMINQKIAALPAETRKRIKFVEDTGIAWVDIWISKLGTAEQKILRFMAGKFPLKMTKSQIALGIGLTAKGGYFSGAFNNLLKNRLIVQHGDNYILAEGPP